MTTNAVDNLRAAQKAVTDEDWQTVSAILFAPRSWPGSLHEDAKAELSLSIYAGE